MFLYKKRYEKICKSYKLKNVCILWESIDWGLKGLVDGLFIL